MKTVTTTVSYWLSPDWYFGFPAKNNGSYHDYTFNPTWGSNTAVGFVQVVTGTTETIPIDQMLVYQWSEKQSGFTGLFVFIAITVLGALTGAAGGLLGTTIMGDLAGSIATGAAAGAVGGLIASGFSPTTNTTADITPFVDSSYDFSQPNLSGDQATVAQRTDSIWLNSSPDSTPGGYQRFVVNMDYRKALACGGASHATSDCMASAITQIGQDDPRWKTLYDEMFINPRKDLQQYTYPFSQ